MYATVCVCARARAIFGENRRRKISCRKRTDSEMAVNAITNWYSRNLVFFVVDYLFASVWHKCSKTRGYLTPLWWLNGQTFDNNDGKRHIVIRSNTYNQISGLILNERLFFSLNIKSNVEDIYVVLPKNLRKHLFIRCTNVDKIHFEINIFFDKINTFSLGYSLKYLYFPKNLQVGSYRVFRNQNLKSETFSFLNCSLFLIFFFNCLIDCT